MLHPDTTVLLTDALRPPAGFQVDQAIATTYSLNLTATLLAPMTFTAGEVGDSHELSRVDPVQLLDAVQRHVEHTTIFVQAGGIHVPSSHSRIHAFLEDSIHEVLPHSREHLFHPKLWAIRYVNEHGHLHHRVLVSSRNLTLDNSWDTVLVLDQDADGAIPAAPAADAVAALPGLALEPLEPVRAENIANLSRTLRAAHLAAPHPFTGGYLLPLGTSEDRPWPFPHNPKRILAISPFITPGTLERIRNKCDDATLVSLPESMDVIGQRYLSGWSTSVLHQNMETSSDDTENVRHLDEFTAIKDSALDSTQAVAQRHGLHAKTVILDLPESRSMVVTGSANLTEQAWTGGLEMNAILTGPTITCGVEAALGRGHETVGLSQVLEPYTIAQEHGTQDPAITTSYELEGFHRELARRRALLEITQTDDDRVSARLNLTLPDHPPGRTKVWLMTVPEQSAPITEEISWQIAPVNVTPYLAVETTAGHGTARVTRRCILMMHIVGDPADRRRNALATILSSRSSLLRYLALLLGMEPASDDATQSPETNEASGGTTDDPGAASEGPSLILFEPLVRASGKDPHSLASVASKIADLRQIPQTAELIPDEFLQMWDVIVESVRDRGSH